MEAVSGERPTIEVLFRAEFARLVRSLAVAEGDDEAVPAVHEAFVETGRRWSQVASLDDPAGWVRRVTVSRLSSGASNPRPGTRRLDAVRPRDSAGALDLDLRDAVLLDGVRKLPAHQRRCLCLHHVGGYPTEEVATALGTAPSTAESHLHHARAALRRAVEETDSGGDVFERLSGLAPNVDEDAAWATIGRARKRRVVRAGVSAGVVAVLVVGAAILSWTHADHRTSVASVPTTAATGGVLSASTVRDGIELTVTLPAGRVDVGRRVQAEVVVRNAGSVPVNWLHGGCVVPASVVLTSVGAPVVGRRVVPQWDGLSPPAGWLGPNNALGPRHLVDPKAAGVRPPSCTTNLVVETIAPGDETRWSGVTDARVAPGPLARQELAADFVGYNQPADYPDRPRPTVEVRVAVPVRDDPARTASAGAAVAAFAADRRLQPFLDRTRLELAGNPVAVLQSWTTELSWWQGTWELWVTPYYNGAHALRLRYDPRAGAVVDGRLVASFQAPEDDPDQPPGLTPDTLLP